MMYIPGFIKERLINSLDFQKIRNIMLIAEHTWSGAGTPSLHRLKQQALRLLDLAKLDEGKMFYRCSTGGFTVQMIRWYPDRPEYVEYQLIFSSASTSSTHDG